MYDFKPVSPRLLAPNLQGSSPRVHLSREAATWYHADFGNTFSPRDTTWDRGTPWDHTIPKQSGSRTSYLSRRPIPGGEGRVFSTLGVIPPAMDAALKGSHYHVQWKGPKPGWGKDLLPPLPDMLAGSLGGGKGSHPIGDDERQQGIWSPRDYQSKTMKPTVPFDPINGTEVAEVPHLESSWATTTSFSFPGPR